MDVEAAIARALPGIARSASAVDRIAYARDLWPRHHLAVRRGQLPQSRPGVVVWPSSTEEVAEVVRFCANEGVPLVPFGAGSGVCGGVLPDERTVVLDLKRLGRRRALDRGVPSVEIEAGATGIRFEEALNTEGFTLGHFPSSILCSTVGGWVAARGAGQCSGLYGKIEDMVAGLEVVLGRGEIVRFSRRTHGPDLTPLFIGSEGVLGVITAATLRLHPAPPARAFGAFSFPSLEAGWTAMQAMFQDGLRPAVSRLYDPFDSFIARMGARRRRAAAHEVTADDAEEHAPGDAMREDPPGVSVERSSSRGGPGAGGRVLRALLRAPGAVNQVVDALGGRVLRGSTLVLIFEGRSRDSHEDLARAAAIGQRHGARPLGEEPARHWLAHRYSVSYRQAPVFMAGAFSDTFEVAAPWSRLGALHQAVRAALGRHVFVMAHLSHAYPDGCSIYFTFAGSAPTEAEAEARYDAAWRDALDAAIASGGTISHHHGVGRSKAPRLGAELGLGVEVIRALRGAFDPAGVMNPGNLLPRAGDPVQRAVSTPPAGPVLDRASLLVHAAGSTSLAEIEHALVQEGLSLGLGAEAPPLDMRLDAWLAAGARGAPDPWLDPVDHLVAGFTARLASGGELEVRPAPRRAVGPDLFTLFQGMEGRAGAVTSAWLRARHAAGPRPMPTTLARNPDVEAAEAGWIEAATRAAAAVG
ncbi:FAD-binding oxidoreductase [Chondromyces apiculatus]|uniref:FAD-binding PCMH-type domain-containing protein n=1 Tax=Chondromyces apiculatus DSM 436 TaxID=1192034 RepID=A0A017TAT8_9BACT|nr:FAD-binding oxidoreductase [Chondromyces apiculatus]EYF06354.1 Hypothetical protein CAP_1884 [Chondromyces apiculatus DSM 436]